MRPSRKVLTAWLMVSVCLAGMAGSGNPALSAHAAGSSLAARIDSYLSAQTRSHAFSGAVVVARGETVVLSKGYAWADWSRRLPNTARTTYPVEQAEAVSVAVLQLVDAGKLRLADPICRYIQSCPTSWAPITVLELLSYTSGLHDYLNAPIKGSLIGRSLSLADLIAYIAREPLDAAPGQVCCAWNADVPVEEAIVERASGESVGAYLQQHIFGPAGLTQTGFYLHYPPNLPQLVVGYQRWQQPTQDLRALRYVARRRPTVRVFG